MISSPSTNAGSQRSHRQGGKRSDSLSEAVSWIDLYLTPSTFSAFAPEEMITFLGSLASLAAPGLPVGILGTSGWASFR